VPAGCLGASHEVLGPCSAHWPLAALPEAANFRRSRFGLCRPQAMALAVFRPLNSPLPARPFRPVTPCWPGASASLSVRLGPFIAALYRAMFQTQTTGLAAAWPGNLVSRRRSWGSMPFAALILSVGPARFRASQPTCHWACDCRLRHFRGGPVAKVGTCGATGQTICPGCWVFRRAIGRCSALLPWAFPLPGFQTPRPVVLPLGAPAGSRHLGRPLVCGVPLPVPDARELGQRSARRLLFSV
jgi:hypothetical protein